MGKISIFRPYPAPTGKFQGQGQQVISLPLPPTALALQNSLLSFPCSSLVAFPCRSVPSSLFPKSLHWDEPSTASAHLVPDPGFISFIWSWFFSWGERGNNCLGATHNFVDLYHNCIISASSLGFMGTLDVIFGASVCSHSHCHRAHIHVDFALEFFPLVYTRTLCNKFTFSW